MSIKSRLSTICIACALMCSPFVQAQSDTVEAPKGSRLTLGGYGEAVYSRHF